MGRVHRGEGAFLTLTKGGVENRVSVCNAALGGFGGESEETRQGE